MVIGRNRFNIYLFLLLALVLAGCKTESQDDPKHLASTIRIHIETAPDSLDFSRTVSVIRQKPVLVTIDRSPFLTESDVAAAKVIDGDDGFSLQIKFAERGTWLLENYTTTRVGKHLAIFCEFGPGLNESRWIAAPRINHRISDGVLTFTPDATREEAEDIATGLDNVGRKVTEKSKW